MKRIYKYVLLVLSVVPLFAVAQVNSVEYGKNRLQFKKFKWKFYQSPKFNTYVSQGGTELGKFVAQIAEEELPSLENFIEYSLQRRSNIVVYNSYDEYKQSNIGLGIDWQNAGGLTKLVNNKIVVFFDGNHEHLRLQIRQGIAKVLTDNLLFGDDIGEVASNQALLDIPKWLTDGYISYAAQNWSTEKDDDLKSAMLSGDYNSFYAFAYAKPTLAGHAFWYYFAEKYKKENVTYFLYLTRMNKNLNKASQKICKKKFKEVLSDFMQFEQDRYYADIRQRRNAPKGTLSVSEDVSTNEYFRFQANPNPRNNNYAVVEFRKGVYRVKYVENFWNTKILLDKGVRTNLGDINPNYPILAWDVKGTRLLVIYWEGGHTKMFVYDVIAKYKRFKQTIDGFDQILDASFMLDANTLVLSAVKNGHSDIYTYKIEEQKTEQITNDIYDDLNPTFVSFPNRSGIIFSSNRPSPLAPDGDTVLPSKHRFNIFLVDILNKNKVKQIAQLTNLKYGNATYPMQYNTNHFTFVADENGIGNRWAGFFSTQRNGLDTLYYVGDEVLHNPVPKELDSTLMAWQKQEPDSISYFQVYKDSTYTFPITNYQSSLIETRIAGNNGQVSETRREGDYKFLYKLKVNEDALNKRNVNPRPTAYMKKIIEDKKIASGKAIVYLKTNKTDTASAKKKIVFQSEFANEKPDTAAKVINENPLIPDVKQTILDRSKLYNYRMKFGADYVLSGITNNILVNRYQPYAGGQGPIQLNNGSDLNWSFRVGTSDLFEDIKFIGGFRFGTNLSDKDVFLSFQNYRRRLDWGFTYYRSNIKTYNGFFLTGPASLYNSSLVTNLYQFNFSYPLNEVKSFRITIGGRNDRGTIRPFNNGTGAPDPYGLAYHDSSATYGVGRFEFVHDNSLNPAQNIWVGSRYKIYLDVNVPINNAGFTTYNLGYDARQYIKIYRNFIWAGRAAGDFSWGKQKIIYYLGGVDGWINPQFNNLTPANDQTYAFQSLAINMRGYNQNAANGNNAVVFNSEFRLPVFTTFFDRPINNAFLRNFQLTQFFDLGTAWNGKFNGIQRPTVYYGQQNPNNPIVVHFDSGGIGPFAAGYGFGARSTVLGYFLKLDTGWPMLGFFKGKPIWYFSLGLDF
ncbi:protein TolB [mine drainage metagenome]|uniref:Protein TolB n=1 Tax=mine drainage metagenome TaxID=410659 RepID=A0A1J5T6T0_9ZZZZ